MTSPDRRPGPPRIGLHGRLGSGNLGNDGTLDALMVHLRAAHPDAEIDFLCSGPEVIERRYGLPARQMHWLHTAAPNRGWRATPPMRIARIAWGAVADAWTTWRWVRGHDVVIVPGMGTLETTLWIRPWQYPLAIFVVCLAGRFTGVRVAFVCVGASEMAPGPTRWLLVHAARLARYRSWRDEYSREQMRLMGVDVRRDRVYPDLVFSLPDPTGRARAEPGSVGVGVIDLASGDESGEVSGAYRRLIVGLVLWLVDHGRPVRMLIGDADDERVARDVLDEVLRSRPALPPRAVVFEPAHTLAALMGQIETVETVVATRFHNVVCAVKAARATLSLGYARKHGELMAEVGTPEFHLDPRSASLPEVVGLLERLDASRATVVAKLTASSHRLAGEVDAQLRAVDDLIAVTGPQSTQVTNASTVRR